MTSRQALLLQRQSEEMCCDDDWPDEPPSNPAVLDHGRPNLPSPPVDDWPDEPPSNPAVLDHVRPNLPSPPVAASDASSSEGFSDHLGSDFSSNSFRQYRPPHSEQRSAKRCKLSAKRGRSLKHEDPDGDYSVQGSSDEDLSDEEEVDIEVEDEEELSEEDIGTEVFDVKNDKYVEIWARRRTELSQGDVGFNSFVSDAVQVAYLAISTVRILKHIL